jgi:hypothetical protein
MVKPKKQTGGSESRIEVLAQMTERGFAALERRVSESERRIVQAIEGLELKVSAYAGQWSRDFERLERRVRALEGRTGDR